MKLNSNDADYAIRNSITNSVREILNFLNSSASIVKSFRTLSWIFNLWQGLEQQVDLFRISLKIYKLLHWNFFKQKIVSRQKLQNKFALKPN